VGERAVEPAITVELLDTIYLLREPNGVTFLPVVL
jgi:hypothetical protein